MDSYKKIYADREKLIYRQIYKNILIQIQIDTQIQRHRQTDIDKENRKRLTVEQIDTHGQMSMNL